jgi:hypothetical protein
MEGAPEIIAKAAITASRMAAARSLVAMHDGEFIATSLFFLRSSIVCYNHAGAWLAGFCREGAGDWIQ